ncbi:hypothetical protein BC828DRAFT_380128 [Blastocladiella britannica]|nr:hypothetical protein BC828DRAFT_380128 [Blastocladiella britannica]
MARHPSHPSPPRIAPVQRWACLLIVLIATTAVTSNARTLWVNPTTGNDANAPCLSSNVPCRTIMAAVNAAATTGDTINLTPGTYTGAGNNGIQFPGKTVTIFGVDGAWQTIIDGGGIAQQFNLAGGEAGWLDGVTVRNGSSIAGGCFVYRNSNFGVRNSIIEKCTAMATPTSTTTDLFAESGGAMFMLNSAPTFSNVTFQFNWANKGAGSVWMDTGAAPIFNDCKFLYDRSESFGGSVVPEADSDARFNNCVWNGCFSKFGGAVDTGTASTTEFRGCDFHNNTAQYGAAIYHYGNENVKVYNSQFYNNVATYNGGASVLSIAVTPTYSGCTFTNNTAAGVGGAIYAELSTFMTFTGNTLTGNSAAGGGGGYYARGDHRVTATNCVVEKNSGLYGGGILFEDDSTGTFTSLTCQQNSAMLDGGCIKVQNRASAVISGSTVSNNIAVTSAGGIAVNGNGHVTVSSTTISSNVASAGYGGGVYGYDWAAMSFASTTFTNNTAPNGGAVATSLFASVTVGTASVIRGNFASNGAGVYTSSTGGLSITGSTIQANKADFGGGIFADAAANQGNNALLTTAVTDNIALGGAAFYYNAWARLLTVGAGVVTTGNTANYGALEATKPYQMYWTIPFASGYSPKDKFKVGLLLVDYFNSTATDTPDQVIVSLSSPDGLVVQSLIPRQGFQNGVALFESVAMTGVLGNQYMLSAVAAGLPTLSTALKVYSCGPGYLRTSAASGSYDCSACPPGTFSLIADGSCMPCPTGADCSQGGANITTLAGFWIDPASMAALEPKVYRCNGQDCLGKGKCDTNRGGRLCAACPAGFSEWGGQCQNCATTSPSWVLIPLTFGLVYGSVLVRFPRLTDAGIPKSLVFFVQTTLVLISNESSHAAKAVLNTFNFGFDWISSIDFRSHCVMHLDPLARIVYNMYEPLTPLMGVIICYIGMRVYHALVVRRKISSYWNWRVMAAFIWTLLWSYLMICKVALSLLNCVQIGDALVLASAPSVVCYSDQHRPYYSFAWAVVILFMLGLPVLCFGLLSYARRRLVKEPNYPLVKELYKAFQPSLWYYEIVLIVRKLLLTLLDVFMAPYEAEHGLALCVFFYASFLLQITMQPFKNRLFNLAEDFLLMSLILMSGIAMGGTMRTNYLSMLNILYATYSFVGLAMAILCVFMAALSPYGSAKINEFFHKHPALHLSLANLSMVHESAYVAHRRKHGAGSDPAVQGSNPGMGMGSHSGIKASGSNLGVGAGRKEVLKSQPLASTDKIAKS